MPFGLPGIGYRPSGMVRIGLFLTVLAVVLWLVATSIIGGQGGLDIQIEDGLSFFTVDEGRLYNLVSLPRYSDHELQLIPKSAGFALFAFTLGG